MTDLVLLGAGHAHVEVLRRFARRPDPGLRVTLIARDPATAYSGRLPALIRGECTPADAHIDLGPLAAVAGARLVVAEATSIDLAARQVVVRGRPPIRFELLSIDIGGIPVMPGGEGPDGQRLYVSDIPVKPIGGFLAGLSQLESNLPQGGRIALVGGGAAGVELALALAQRVAGRVRITLVCDTPEPLAEAPPRARAVARAALANARVELVCGVRAGARAGGRAGGKLALSDGSFLAVDAVLWATNVGGPRILAESGLICDEAGCVVVDSSLRSRGHDIVFAAGDCASIAGAPRPKAGVWAVRAGPRLADNLRRAARGVRARPWRPQAEALAIVGLGHGQALAWRNGLAVSGRLVGWYKDWIDGRFLRRYATAGLPRLGAQPEPRQVSLDPADLAVLSSPPPSPPHPGQSGAPVQAVRSDLADDANARVIQHATYLPAVLNDPFEFGRIVAAHALVRLHAANARPGTAVAVVTPPAGTQASARADVMALLQGASEILAADGATLIDCAIATGGAAGASLVLTGRAARAGESAAGPTPYPSLRAGDVLILTKPLGSGIILEGYRRGLAQAHWLLEALAMMTASSAVALRILRQHGAAACAAVAEHGLVGTLTGVLRDANLAAVLLTDGIPALAGVRDLAHLGVARATADDNRQAWPDPPDWPDLALLTDPQIAGGLLAGVADTRAAACLAALHAAGYEAACIGQTEVRRLDAPRLRLELAASSATAPGESTTGDPTTGGPTTGEIP